MEQSVVFGANSKFAPYVSDRRTVVKDVPMRGALAFARDIANATYESLLSVGYEGNISNDDLEKVLVGLVNLRIWQVGGGKPPRGVRWQDVRVPSVIFPLLAQIGKFRDESQGIDLRPVLHEDVVDFDNVSGEIVVLADRVCRSLSYWGLGWSEGLPKDREVQSDVLFQLQILEDEVVGMRVVPDPVQLMLRAFVESATLDQVYGQPRITYATVSYLKRAFIDSVSRQLKHPSAIKV